MNGMLSGITVIDLTRHLAGPFCTMTLSDMGADVIKVEPLPLGDESRTAGPFIKGESGYFMSVNRGKKGMTLNIKSNEGKEILRKLIQRGDIIVESFRPGVAKRLGFSYEDVIKINPRIIYASVSGFGQYGPYKDKGAYDVVIQGYAGTISITGTAGGEPVRVGYSIGDLAASLYTTIGILGALHARKQTGKGQHIDVAMLDCQVSLLENAILRYTTTGQIAGPIGTRHPALAPFQAFEAEDGYFIICAPHDKQFKSLCEIVGEKNLIDDERFSSNRMRVEHIDELSNILNNILKQKPRDYWITSLEKAGVPTGPINNIREMIDSPQIKARKMIVEVDHPVAGKVKIAGSPIKSSMTPARIQGPAPILGQDTDKILKTLGYSEKEVDLLREKGVI